MLRVTTQSIRDLTWDDVEAIAESDAAIVKTRTDTYGVTVREDSVNGLYLTLKGYLGNFIIYTAVPGTDGPALLDEEDFEIIGW